MDNAYRFGDIDVSCEGYDYADDPYILKGSCGVSDKHVIIILGFWSVRKILLGGGILTNICVIVVKIKIITSPVEC